MIRRFDVHVPPARAALKAAILVVLFAVSTAVTYVALVVIGR